MVSTDTAGTLAASCRIDVIAKLEPTIEVLDWTTTSSISTREGTKFKAWNGSGSGATSNS